MRTSPGPGPRARARCRRIALLGPRLRLPTFADFRATCGFAQASVRPSTLRAAEITSRLLAWAEMTIAGRSLRVRVRAVRLAKRCARAFLEVLRAPTVAGPVRREPCERPRHAVPAEILPRRRLTKGGAVERTRVPSIATKCGLTRGGANRCLRSSNRGPVTPPPKRHCSRPTRLWYLPVTALA